MELGSLAVGDLPPPQTSSISQWSYQLEIPRRGANTDPVVWDRRRFEMFLAWAYRLRGLHASSKTRARLLRFAATVARASDRLGQCLGARRAVNARAWLCGGQRLQKQQPGEGEI